MVASRGSGSRASAQETFAQMAKASGLRGRILFTLGIVILVQLGNHVPLPGVDTKAFSQALESGGLAALAGLLSLFSRGFSILGVFALGIIPYINASIILQLLTPVIPALEKLQKDEGEQGRKQIAQSTRYLALAWGIIQSIGITFALKNIPGAVPPENFTPFFIFQCITILTAGSVLVMWFSELVTEKGIGNGASLLIFVNIVASLPSSFSKTAELVQADSTKIAGVVILAITFLAMIAAIIFVQEGLRKIPILSAKRQVGPGGMNYKKQETSYLPLRVNQGGVMPIIFASSLLILPISLAQYANNDITTQIANALSPSSWIHTVLYVVLIVFFSYFYSTLVINPEDLSKNLKKMGASIPGVRPGKNTSDYVEKIINRLTIIGAIFLAVVALVPTAVEQATGITTFGGLGATSILILVGVAIDTAKQIQTYVISQRYEGMVKK
jgi:preprotein translocase subunit SecY